MAAIAGNQPFIMKPDGLAWLYASGAVKDGPLPTHYEPEESALENLLYQQQCNPRRLEWHTRSNPYHRAFKDPRYPFVLTTYRLTEHFHYWTQHQQKGLLNQLQPGFFVEIPEGLAREKGIVIKDPQFRLDLSLR